MKKTTKLLFTLLLSSIIFISNSPVTFAGNFILLETDEIEQELYNTASNGSFDTIEKYIGDIDEFQKYILECILTDESNLANSNNKGSIDISEYNIPYSTSNLSELANLIYNESPELFRIKSIGVTYYPSGAMVEIKPTYHFSTSAEFQQHYNKFIDVSEKMLKGVKNNPALNDIEKALILHDRLALNCVYNSENPDTPSAHTIYGVFCLGTAVCQGYAYAYDYLLEQVGIEAQYCSSDTLNHAWNIVYINNTPYHVDVTWDDPVWDMYGRVSHENFLRSTQGIKDTGHTATDFFSSPADTSYDDYYWQNLNTAFQLINNEIYYFNTDSKELCKLNDIITGESSVLKTVNDRWTTSGGFYSNSFTKLLSDNYYLYYNTKDTVYRYNPETDVEETAFSPDVKSFGDYHWIYGMNYSDCKIICEVYSSPNFNADVKKSYTLTTDVHTPSDWVTTKEPTIDETGEKQQKCLNCEQIINTEIIPEVFVAPTENTDTIIEDDFIFTSTDLCNDIETLVNFSDNVTYEISSSFKTSTTEFLGTGSIISIYENGEKVIEYKVIVAGDLNGDSVCDVLDVASAELSVTNNRIPSADECYAANGTKKDNIDEASFQFVVNTALSE